MKLIKVRKPGQPDLHIHEDAVEQHERLGWTVEGEEEVAPPEPIKAKSRVKATAEGAGSAAEGDGGEDAGVEGRA